MLFLWMAIQLIALALAAGRVPLSARFPQPAESMATVEMLVAQIGSASLLFPLLLKDFRRFVLAAAGAWPMLFLAADLGGEPFLRVAVAAGFVSVWLLTLYIWVLAIRSSRWISIVIAIAALWTIGGPVLLYLHAEYGEQNHLQFWNALAGPIGAGLNHLKNPEFSVIFDLPTLCLLTIGIAFAAKTRR
jgi:hypothetical protein